MTAIRQYADLVMLHLRMTRQFIIVISVINLAFSVGLVALFSYLFPDVPGTTARLLVAGTATQMVVTIGLVVLPQYLSEAKHEGRMEFFFTLPISREAYLLSLVTIAVFHAIPALVFSVLIGTWRYDLSLSVSPWVLLVVPLAVLSLAGMGIALAVISPHMQLTNAITQLIIFYVLFFAPVLMPKEQLPAVLQHTADFLPPTYAANAFRATVTDLPGTHLFRSLLVMAGFGAGSLALAATSVRRRG